MATKPALQKLAFYFGLACLVFLFAKLGQTVLNIEFKDEKQIQGAWLGSYQEFRNERLPFPVIYDFKPKGRMELFEIDSDYSNIMNWQIKGNKIILDTFDFDLLELNDERLSYNKNNPRVLTRISSHLPGKSVDEFKLFLQNSIWQSTKEKERVLHFEDSTIFYQMSGFQESRCWDVFQFKTSMILYFKESVNCQGSSGRFYEVLDFHADRLVLKGFNEIESDKSVYIKRKTLPEDFFSPPAEFQICNFYGVRSHLSIADANEFGGRYIEDFFFENFDCDQLWKGNSGYLRLKFIINCNGQTGHYDWQTMDKAYASKAFPESMTEHLLQLFTKLDGWEPLERNGRLTDAWKSIIFKIEDGNLVSVSP